MIYNYSKKWNNDENFWNWSIYLFISFFFQVGRLSRQAAEESSERRRAVQEKDKLVDKVKQLEAELECNRFELGNKEAKIKRLTEDVNEMAAELKAIQTESEEEITFLRTELVSDPSL